MLWIYILLQRFRNRQSRQSVSLYKLNSNTNETITDISFINNRGEGIICGESGFCSKTTNGGALCRTTLNTGIPFCKCVYV